MELAKNAKKKSHHVKYISEQAETIKERLCKSLAYSTLGDIPELRHSNICTYTPIYKPYILI